MRFVVNFNENYFSRIKYNEISLCLFNIEYKRYELKQNNYDDKI